MTTRKPTCGPQSSLRWSELTNDIEHVANVPEGTEVKAKATVQVGFYSTDGGQAFSFLVEVPRLASDAALGLVVGSIAYKGVGAIVYKLTPEYLNWCRLSDEASKARAAL